MSVSIKSAKEIELMREAGRLLSITHEELERQSNQESAPMKLTG